MASTSIFSASTLPPRYKLLFIVIIVCIVFVISGVIGNKSVGDVINDLYTIVTVASYLKQMNLTLLEDYNLTVMSMTSFFFNH